MLIYVNMQMYMCNNQLVNLCVWQYIANYHIHCRMNYVLLYHNIIGNDISNLCDHDMLTFNSLKSRVHIKPLSFQLRRTRRQCCQYANFWITLVSNFAYVPGCRWIQHGIRASLCCFPMSYYINSIGQVEILNSFNCFILQNFFENKFI